MIHLFQIDMFCVLAADKATGQFDFSGLEKRFSIFHITNDIVFMKMIGKRLDDALEAIGF